MGDALRADALTSEVSINVLGPWDVRVDNRVVDIPRGQLRTFLASLLLSMHEPVPVATLVDRAWPERVPGQARATLHTYATRLRKLLGPDLIETTRGGGYQLRVPPAAVDLYRFRGLLCEAQVAESADAELTLLREGLGLWRGRPFGDESSTWLDRDVVPRLTEEWFCGTERRIELELASGQAGRLVPELWDLTDRFPTRESLWVLLISALHRAGRRAEALHAYQRVRAVLNDELGIDPSERLTQLQRSILRDGTDAAAAVPAGHETRPRQLPHDIASFSGRDGELGTLDQLAAAVTALPTIVAIDGAPGTGKTALAVHWAHRVAERYPDAQLYVNLRGYGPGDPISPAAASEMLLRAIGVGNDAIPAGVDERSALLRTRLAGRRTLILLDNASDADQVRPLLPGSEGLVIVTSRNQLRGLSVRDGAHRLTLRRLPEAQAVELLGAAVGEERVAAEPAATARLVALCDHLPLALAIAAERAARRPGPGPVGSGLAATVAELKGQLDRLDALETGDDTAANLRAVFSWSYDELDPDSARAFRLLGLHPGPDLSLPAAAALLGASSADVRRLLGVLVDGHLVARRRPGRYELHDLLRVYAEELALQVDDDAARADAVDRVENWYLHTAANAHGRLDATPPLVRIGTPRPDVVPLRFDGEGTAASWFDAERQVLAALVQAAATDGRQRSVYELASRMSAYLITRHDVGQLIELDGLALTAAIQAGDRGAEAGTACRLGWNYRLKGDMRQAQIHLERGVELLGSLGDDAGKCTALGSLGVVCRSAGATAQAIGHHQEALAIACKLGDDRLVANRLNNLAMTHLAVGLPADAEEGASKAAEVHRGSGDRRNESHALDTLGLALAAQGRYQEAIACYRRALELAGAIRDRWGEVTYLTNLGVALRDHGDPGQARRSWERALAIMDDLVAVTHGEPSRAQLEALIRSATTDRDRTS